VGKPIRMWIALMVFLWLTVGQALALVEGGPVRVEVDKAQGTPGTVLEKPVKGADLPKAEFRAARPVEHAKGEATLGKKPSLPYRFWNWVVEALTGVDLKGWAKPERLWYNIGNAVLELLTGTGIEKYKDWRNWGVGDYLWTAANVLLTVFTFGGGSVLKSVAIKLLGPVGRFTMKVLKPIGKGLGIVAGPVKVFFTMGRGAVITRFFKARAAWLTSRAQVHAVREFAVKAIQWVRAKGFSGLAKYTDPNPLKNQFVNDVFGWVVKTQVWTRASEKVATSLLGRAATAAKTFLTMPFRMVRGWIGSNLVGRVANWVGGMQIGQFTVREILESTKIGLKDLVAATVKRNPVSLITGGVQKVLTAFKERLEGTALLWAERTITFLKIREEADAAKKLWEKGMSVVRILPDKIQVALWRAHRGIALVSATTAAVLTAARSTAVRVVRDAIRGAIVVSRAVGQFSSRVVRSAKQRYRRRPRLAR
jgi:hypothetical protein